MSELVRRRMKRGDPPDLFVVDGGKGHLSAVKRILDELPREPVPDAVSIAKADEKAGETADKVYLPGRKNPLPLKEGDPVLFLLMRVRDEAHRRAVTYHRKRRHLELKESRIDQISGIGPRRKRLLLQHLGDMDAVSRATPDELALVPGINRPLAEKIAAFFSREQEKDNLAR